MRRLLFIMTMAGNYVVQRAGDDSPDEICLSFSGGWQLIRRKTLAFREGVLESNGIEWIWSRGNDWYIDFNTLKQKFEFLQDLEWLKGISPVAPDFAEYSRFGGNGTRTSLEFHVYRDEFVIDRKRKLFLSHKGADKPIVRSFSRTLRTLGFDPWLDEDSMVAGTQLDRGLLDGFDQSCAAIFFVTPRFKDIGFLATEVNYAMAEKRKKGDRFAIITIVFGDGPEKGTVPPLLEQYVWKEPANDLVALEEIIRALPIELNEPTWRGHIALA